MVGDAKPAETPATDDAVKLVFRFKVGGTDSARSLDFSPDGSRLVCVGWDGGVHVWDTATGTPQFQIEKSSDKWTSVKYSPDGKSLALGSFQGVVAIYDAINGKRLAKLEGHRGFINHLAFVNDDSTLVTADSNGIMRFWSWTTKKELPDRELTLGKYAHAAITADGRTVVSSGSEKGALTLNIWAAAARKKSGTVETPQRGLFALAVTADGKTAVTGHQEEGVIWDLTDKKRRATLVGHSRDVFAVALTADDKTVATGSLDETVKLWDIATGGERLTLAVDRGSEMIVSVALSRDGKLVAAGRSSSVLVWRLSRSASAFDAKPPRPAKVAHTNNAPAEQDKERRLIQEKAEALAQQGAQGVVELTKKLREGARAWKLAALTNLRALGPDAEPALDAVIQELSSKDIDLKRLALETLAAIGPKAKKAIPTVIEASSETRDFDGSIRFSGPSNTAEAALMAIESLDPSAMPRLAKTMIPALLKVVEKGGPGPTHNALALLRRLGPHARPALPQLKAGLSEMPTQNLHEILPIFLATGEEGTRLLADYVLESKTTTETKLALMAGYHWESRTTPSTVRMLRGLLKDKSPALRVSALQALRSARAAEVIPELIELLPDAALLKVPSEHKGDDPFYVAAALAHQGKDAVAPLIKALDHRAPLARYQAARALAALGKDAAPARTALEGLLKDGVPLVEIEAAKAILKTGKTHPQALAKLEKHLDADARLLGVAVEAVKDIGAAGRPLAPTIKKLTLDAAQLPLQRAGLDALRRIKADSKDIVLVWMKCMKENPALLTFPPEDELRDNAAAARSCLPVLSKYLKSEDVNVRRRVTEILKIMGPTAKDAMPDLIKALDDDSFVSSGAVAALAALGRDARPAVKALVQRFENLKNLEAAGKEREGPYHRREILSALEQIGPGARDAVPKLIEWLPEYPQAARVLGMIGAAAKDGVPALEKMYQSESSYEKSASAFALLRITGKKEPYLSELVEILQKSKDVSVRAHVIEMLHVLGTDARPALPALLALVKQRSNRSPGLTDLREAAARALAVFGADAKPAVPALVDMVRTSYYRAKITAAETLGAIGPGAKEAIPDLRKMAAEDERFVAVVEKALARIEGKSKAAPHEPAQKH
ncbi:MAG TPA: HEAT repeat domain-containing protein [Gemmataceae bacterium]